jgi:hypothetical protein
MGNQVVATKCSSSHHKKAGAKAPVFLSRQQTVEVGI